MVKEVLYGKRQVVKGKMDFVAMPMFVVGDDPDPNYVLTMDNAKKIIAIHQRLRWAKTCHVDFSLWYK